jgi:hypothetical protein
MDAPSPVEAGALASSKGLAHPKGLVRLKSKGLARPTSKGQVPVAAAGAWAVGMGAHSPVEAGALASSKVLAAEVLVIGVISRRAPVGAGALASPKLHLTSKVPAEAAAEVPAMGVTSRAPLA